MKYRDELTLERPRDEVIALFDDTDNLFKWQEGLQAFEHVEGEPGHPGAVSHLKYQMGKRQIEMVETIIARDLPDQFIGTYEADGVYNEVANHFVAVSDTQTLWRCESTFQFSGFGMKLMALLMPFLFKSQTRKFMLNFKKFAETGWTVTEETS